VNVTQWAESEWNYVSCLIVVWLNNCLSCLVLPCQVIYTVFGLLKLRIVFFTEVYRRLEGCVWIILFVLMRKKASFSQSTECFRRS